nr:coiled-coil domain-containing protein 57-like [Loxodonta africana]
MDAVRLQLPREVDHVHVEVLELGKQVAELEKHLGATRKEGGKAVGRTPETTALRRQAPAGGEPTGNGDPGPQPEQRSSELRLQRKLRAATKSILRLQQDKERLMEAGNRLRAGLGRPRETVRTPPRPSLPAPQARSPGEVPGPPPDGSLPLGQMQPCFTVQSQPRIPTVTCKSSRQKENRSPKPPQAQEPCEENSRHTQRSLSLVSSSLQDTWKLLDLGSSPSGPTSQDDSTPERPAPAEASSPQPPQNHAMTQGKVAIEGKKVEAQPKPKPTRPPRSSPAKPRDHEQPPRIRNYNVKD